MRTKIRRPLGGFALSSFPHEAKDETCPTDVKAMLLPIFLANRRGKRGCAGRQSQIAGERKEGVTLLRMMLERSKLTVFWIESSTWRSRRAKAPQPRLSIGANVKAARSNVPLCAVNQLTKESGSILGMSQPTGLWNHMLFDLLSTQLMSIRAIQDHHLSLNALYFDHRETVQHLQNVMLTQILPNVVDELGLDKAARNWVEEWLHDDCKSQSFSPIV